ncbi:hypothetical protein CABS01_16346 [Colletotrichum abscissum]|uniref:uncharacterized protein n=1 Tax=Colletotrichum abscissum TaxID=1671311 RepID=UPI0027D5AA8B|nr:uncharacterized protein CABS01_16346 [Colletotrichum abscissum]KAK1471637.1 hypothetical protein CABS01_16346 [Colletotrichum abscissum]
MSFNFWTPPLKADFHRVLTSMRQLTDVPSEPRTYRGGRTSQSDTHTLSIEDEMQCADAIAFLAHHKEGAQFVSTVTLRECHERLRIVLAGNTTPSSKVQDELAKVMDHGKLLEMVIRLNSSRILSRLRPTWVAQPRHFTRRQMSLQGRVQTCIVRIEKSLQSTAQITQVLERLKGLGDTLKLVEHPTEPSALLDAIKTIVENCAQVASLGSANSVEEHLKSLGVGKRLAESPEIRQIDKLARYFFTCKDLTRLAKKTRYRHLFGHVEVVALESPAGIIPPGVAQYCFVHAEVQQIFDLERQPHVPAPRAIGCSKSASYLCDLFIRMHGVYVVSHTHGRLYEEWTLPDVDWMTAKETERFRSVIDCMTRDMGEAIQRLKVERRIVYCYPLESRACLPLSSGATSSLTERLTEVEGNVIPARHGNVEDAMLPRRHSWPVMLSHFVKITELELPWHRYALVGQGPLHIQIDRLSLHMEFASTATGLLSVYRRHDGALDEGKILKAADIPMDSNLLIRGCRATGKVAFGISLNAIVVVQIEFVWDTPSHQ